MPIVLRQEELGPLQLRYHPLSNDQVRINPNRAKRPKQGSGIGDTLGLVIQKAAETSPFSRKRIFDKVPKFHDGFCEGGRIIVGESVTFPNLNPFADHHAVIVLCEADFLNTDQFTPTLIGDGITAGLQFFTRTQQEFPDCKYPTLVWNYMPPSAGSIIHPHLQVFMEKKPLPALAKLITTAQEYQQQHKTNFYADLVAHEKNVQDRFIMEHNGINVVANFAPRGLNELNIIIPSVSSILDLTPQLVASLSEVLSKLLQIYYKSFGVQSFNLASYSEAKGENTNSFSLGFKLFSRPNPDGIYTNDTGPLERVYDSWVIDSIPEEVAKVFRESLSS